MPTALRPSPTTRRLVLLLTLLVAAWLRLHRLPELPPGLHYDEAANGVLAADIGVRGARPIFIPSYTGKEVLFFYLAGVLSRLVGETPFALRLTSALVGLTTAAATAWLGRELWPRRPWIGVWAAVLLATAFPHLIFSRLGFRVITLPLLMTLTMAALWRSARRGSRPWAAAAGALLGLTGYTYLAARLFPLVVAGTLPLLFWRRGRRGAQQVALVLGAALVTVAPLSFYFWQHPDAFWVRIGQVTPGEGGAAAYLDGLARGLGMFFVQGDPYWRFNIPGRPLLGWAQAALWVGGVALLTWRARSDADARPALWLVLAGPLVMVLPSALAVGEITPSNLRALGVWPLLLYPIAYALAALTEWRPIRAWAVWAAVIALPVGAVLTGRAYFDEWTQRADLFYDSDADLLAVGRYLDATARSDETLYVAALHYRHPTLAFTSRSYARIKWLVGGSAWVAPAAGPARVVFPHNVPPADWLAAQLPTPELGPPGPDGAPTFRAYRLEQPIVPALPQTLTAEFGGVVALTGVAWEQTAADALRVRLTWQVTAAPTAGYRPYVHLLDAGGYRWAQADSIAYLAEQWAPGEAIVEALDLRLPPGLPGGPYRLEIGLFAEERRLALQDSAGRYAGSAVQVTDLALRGNPAPPTAQPPLPVDREPAPGLRLLGYERGGPTVEAGAPFWLALWWQAERPLPPLRTQLALTDAAGRTVVWLTADPARGAYPFAAWPAPAFVRDHVAAVLPADWPPGDYALTLELVDAAGRPMGEAVPLGALTVLAAERRFEAPPTAETTTAVFGGEIALRGYTLRPVDGQTAELQLVWQALTPPAQDYTVFVHLLTPEGVCCLWQQDVMPRQNGYPTTRWLADEVVVDRYTIPTAELPPGRYPLEIGLYLAETGQRLGVAGTAEAADYLMLAPLVIEP